MHQGWTLYSFPMADRRTCSAHGCENRFQGPGNQKYCSKTCRDRVAKANWRAKQKTEQFDDVRLVRGDVYTTLLNNPELVEAIDDGRISQRELGRTLGVAHGQVRSAFAAYKVDEQNTQLAIGWEMDAEMERWLCLDVHDWDGDVVDKDNGQ